MKSHQPIIDFVCAHYGVTPDELMARDRHKSVVEARQIAIWLCRRRLRMSFPELGRAFGNRDHTTCMSACHRIDKAQGILYELSRDLEARLPTVRLCGPWESSTGAREIEFAAAE